MAQAARGLSTLLAVCSFVAVAAAQTPPRGADVRNREIYVSVLDNKGVPVTGLTPADLVVKEDGAVREVLDVKPADAPLQIALLIDDSAAASEATSYLREGLTAFLERMRGRAEIGLITVGERPTVLAPYTTDTAILNKHVGRIFPRSQSGAYLLDAIVDASKALAKREAARPVILALTFEGVEHSNMHYEVVLRELMKSGAALHVIAIGTPSGSMDDEMRNRGQVLAEGTVRTGGRRDQVLAVSGIPDKLKQAADELLNQYVVTYGRPDKLIPPDKITVSTTRPNVTVRARTRVANR
jgi:VWFA-related protein